jgi:SAM-dependent methyltransferase
MNVQTHWEGVYRTRRTDEVSWFTPHLDMSMALSRSTCAGAGAPIIDVGGGASTLVDDLLAAGYRDVTVLDLSAAALEVARRRVGPRASDVTWLAHDVTRAQLPRSHFSVWHDRAVFHFLVDSIDRERYIAQVRRAVAPGGHVVVATFGPQGPQRCSGLPTARYDAHTLHAVFGDEFEMVDRRQEEHRTPAGTQQQFVYCL